MTVLCTRQTVYHYHSCREYRRQLNTTRLYLPTYLLELRILCSWEGCFLIKPQYRKRCAGLIYINNNSGCCFNTVFTIRQCNFLYRKYGYRCLFVCTKHLPYPLLYTAENKNKKTQTSAIRVTVHDSPQTRSIRLGLIQPGECQGQGYVPIIFHVLFFHFNNRSSPHPLRNGIITADSNKRRREERRRKKSTLLHRLHRLHRLRSRDLSRRSANIDLEIPLLDVFLDRIQAGGRRARFPHRAAALHVVSPEGGGGAGGGGGSSLHRRRRPSPRASCL